MRRRIGVGARPEVEAHGWSQRGITKHDGHEPLEIGLHDLLMLSRDTDHTGGVAHGPDLPHDIGASGAWVGLGALRSDGERKHRRWIRGEKSKKKKTRRKEQAPFHAKLPFSKRRTS